MPTMLTSRISVPIPSSPEVEDIFCSALGVMFTDDTVNSHGTPGSKVFYRSPRFGEMTLHIPAHPDVEDGRQLFAHYLWNAAVIAAEAIEQASTAAKSESESEGEDALKRLPTSASEEADAGVYALWNPQYWDMRGKRVLELGAGTALPSLISALSGAASCTITDHPSSPALTTDAITRNVRENLFHKPRLDVESPQSPTPTSSSSQIPDGSLSTARTQTSVAVYGYTWGSTAFYEADKYGRPAKAAASASATTTTKGETGLFNRIIIADCLWMPSQHLNLVRTILQYLDPTDPTSCALVVAGFHTGRSTVRDFFAAATTADDAGSSRERYTESKEQHDEVNSESAAAGIDEKETDVRPGLLRIEEIFEVDVEGNRRVWEPDLLGESKEQAKRWCVCAIVARR